MPRKRKRPAADASPAPQSRPADLRPVIAAGLTLIILMSWLFGVLPGYKPADGAEAGGSVITDLLWLLLTLPLEIPHVLGRLADMIGGLVRQPALVGGMLADSALLLVMIAAAFSAGMLVLRLVGKRPRAVSDRLLYGIGIGLGVMAYQTLGMGLLGVMNRWLHLGLLGLWIAAGVLLEARDLRERLTRWRREGRGEAARKRFDYVLIAAIVASIVLAFLAARVPVVAYDSLEYHLGAPARHFREGRIDFMPWNVYGNFPEHAETLYLLGMILGGGPERGLSLALLVQVSFGVLTALALRRMVGRHFGPRAGLAAAAFFAACPMFVSVVYSAYITLAVCCYLALTTDAFLRWLTCPERARSRWLITAGICAGLAAATKYTGIAFVCLPIGLAVLIFSVWRGRPSKRLLIAGAIFAGAALLVFMPWMVKNFAYTRNPTYPLLYSVFDGKHWSPPQHAKWRQAHAPGPVRPIPAAKQLWRLLIAGPTDPETGPHEGEFVSALAILFIPLLLLRAKPREEPSGEQPRPVPVLLMLGVYFGLYWLLWYLLTHRIDRFLAPAAVVLCALSGAGYAAGVRYKRLRLPVCVLTVLALLLSLMYQTLSAAEAGALSVPFGNETRQAFFKRIGFLPHWQAMQAINRLPGDDVKVLFVGEAQTFYCRRDCIAPVVFNPHPLSDVLQLAWEHPGLARQRLRERGYTHLLVHYSELQRLRETYTFEFRGERIPGYLPALDPRTLEPLRSILRMARLVDQQLVTGPHGQQYPLIELYELPAEQP